MSQAMPPARIGFGDAVWMVLSKYATFSGRATRPEYWWWFLFWVITYVATIVLDSALGANGVLELLVVLALLLPNISVTVRRLHDTGRSGWWFLINLVPCVGWIVLLVFTLEPSKGPNKYGPGPGGSGGYGDWTGGPPGYGPPPGGPVGYGPPSG